MIINKNNKIAFFDSGVGGLTVLKEFKKLLPNEDCIYFGDLNNSPYGEKSKNELIIIADKVFRYLENLDVKAVVMACNTTSANTYEELKDKYNFKIYPIIQSAAYEISKFQIEKVGVFATKATIASNVYSKELKKYNKNLQVFEISCPPWVQIVENNEQNLEENIEKIKFYLDEMLEFNPDKIIFGCTHYPFLIDVLSKFVSKDMFINPSQYFVEFIKNDLSKNNLLNTKTEIGKDEFYVTAFAQRFKMAAQMFYKLDSLPTLVNI